MTRIQSLSRPCVFTLQKLSFLHSEGERRAQSAQRAHAMLAPDRDPHHIPVRHSPASAPLHTACAAGRGGASQAVECCVRLP